MEEETSATTTATVLAADVVRILWSRGGSRRSRLRTTRRTRKHITSSSVRLDTVGASTTPDTSNGDILSKSCKIIAIPNIGALVAWIVGREATRIDEEGLDVRWLSRKNLVGVDARTSNYRGIVMRTITLTSVVRRRYGWLNQYVTNRLHGCLRDMLEKA
jgi:hypothetical protein